MTTALDVGNEALQIAGTRTNMTQSELDNNSSNEAIQVNLAIYKLRDSLLRMAPWDCAFNFANLNYITSTPGTPENPGQVTQTWVKGQPAPPWSYEYAYPGDCLRACWVVPWMNTGFAGGIPITTAVTNVGAGTPTNWGAPAMPFKIGIDQFYSITAAAIVSGGTGYVVGDLIFLPPGQYSPTNLPTFNPPIGGPAILQVLAVAGGVITQIGVVLTFQQSIPGDNEIYSGQYFRQGMQQLTNPVAQSSTTGSGTGATFNLTWTTSPSDQRVIWTGQEFATLAYIKQVLDPNTMDELFLQGWKHILGARLAFQLSGDKALANQLVSLANAAVMEARKADGNEGLTVNDVTPDWIRIRGAFSPNWEYSNSIGGFNWGPLFLGF